MSITTETSLPGKDLEIRVQLSREDWAFLRDRHAELSKEKDYLLLPDPLSNDYVHIGVMNDTQTGDPIYFALGFQYEEPPLLNGEAIPPRLYLRTEDGWGIKVIINEHQLWSQFDRSAMLEGDLNCIQKIRRQLAYIRVIRRSSTGKSIVGLPVWKD